MNVLARHEAVNVVIRDPSIPVGRDYGAIA